MPIRTGKSVGSQNIAKGGVNQYVITPAIGIGAIFTGDWLRCPGLPKLSVVANQGAGVAGLVLDFQVAARIGQAGVLTPHQVGPQIILNPGATNSTVLEFNLPVEAMRIRLLNTGPLAAGTEACTFLLTASG